MTAANSHKLHFTKLIFGDQTSDYRHMKELVKTDHSAKCKITDTSKPENKYDGKARKEYL